MSQKPLIYAPLKKDQHFTQRICALDFETEGLGGRELCVSWAILTLDGQIQESGVDCEDGFIERLMHLILSIGSNTVWYSHNAQYDWRYLMNYIIQERAKLLPQFGMRTADSVYQIVLHPYADAEQEIVLRDSFALWVDNLEGLTKTWAPDHAKLSGTIKFDEGEIFNTQNPQHLEYALRDSEALALAMFNLNKRIEELYGVPIGHTVAGTAVKAWRRTLEEPHFTHRPSMEFCRKAYYGGLVFLTDTNKHINVSSYDINSSYPNVMQKYGVPEGTPLKTRKWYTKEFPAIYHCRITAPDSIRVPIIPSRNVHGLTRWMTGRIETHVTNAELEFALKHGYTDLEIIDGFVWENFYFPFDAFVEQAKSIRAEFKGKPSEQLAKRIQNSLYGKMGTKQERNDVFIPVDLEDTFDATPLDDNDIFWVRKEFDEDILCNPAWAAFITAHGRLELLRNVYDIIGVEHCLYGDTDSITVTEDADVSGIDIGNEYGQFKRDKEWACFRAIAPKVYAGKMKGTEKWKGACKGIPLKAAKNHFEELYHQKMISSEYETLQSFWVGIKKGFTPAHIATRISTDIANSGSWELRADGTIWPKRISE